MDTAPLDAETFFNLGVSRHGRTLKKLPKDEFPAYSNVRSLMSCAAWGMLTKETGKMDEVHEHVPVRAFNQFATIAITLDKYNHRHRRYDASSSRKYKVFETRQSLERFVGEMPPYRRHLEEMIFTDTPHRFYMDIEKDLPGCTQEDLDKLLAFLLDRFLRVVTEFFNDTFDIHCTLEHWRVCVASKAGKKFSVHVLLGGPFYCGTRLCSWTIAALMARHLAAIEDREFVEWYNVNPANARCSEKVVDYHVYHAGLRNMRFLGCIKLEGPLNIDWLEMRPFRPIPSQAHLPWTDFLCTVNHAPEDGGFTRLVVQRDLLDGLSEWVNLELGATTFIGKDFKSLLGRLGVRRAPISRTCARPAVTLDRPGAAAAEPPVLARILAMINAMGDIERVGGHNGTSRQERCDREREAKDRFFAVAKNLGRKMVQLLHAGNHPSEQPPDASRGEVYKLRFSTLVKGPGGMQVMRLNDRGVQKEQRLCYFSYTEKLDYGPCQSGGHNAELTVMSDFSVEYFCFGCCDRQPSRQVIVSSPIENFTVRPKLYDCRPTEFSAEIDYINYSEKEDYDDISPYMRDIKPLEPSGLYWEKGRFRTVMLHGAMGTGKSQACKTYLRRTEKSIRAQTQREPRILSITFRMMLACSNAKTFGLLAYNDDSAPTELFEYDRVACQLDSICRLGKIEGQSHFVLKDPWDVILLDESESILSHLSSSTLERKRAEVFEVFKQLVSRANTVIVADADMARRTRHFISVVRPVSAGCLLEYHRNPFVCKELEYLDYKHLDTWLHDFTEAVLGPQYKCVFVVSNNKAKLKALQRYLERELSERVRRMKGTRLSGARRAHFERLKAFQEDPHFSKIIDAENNGAEKKRMAEQCNAMWSEYRVLGITPVVGAGISFDKEDHFHEAYLFATPSSCCPRAINQLLGRVRHLKENRVRLYIDDSTPMTRSDQVTDEDGLYKKIRKQDLNVKSVKLDRMSVKFAPSENTLSYCIRRDDDLLIRLHAMNEEETIKGRIEFRYELIRVLQRNNPALKYRFETRGDFKADTRALMKFQDIRYDIEDEETLVTCIQQHEVEAGELLRVKRINDKGGVVYEDDHSRQEDVTKIIAKSEVAQQLKLAPDTEDAVFEAYIELLQSLPDGIETVANAARYLFGTIHGLRSSVNHLLAERSYELENAPEFLHTVPERVTQGLDNLEYRRKYWLRMLLFICGFLGETLQPETDEDAFIEKLEGHSFLQSANLDKEEIQCWLKKHVPAILDDLGTTMAKAQVKPKEKLADGERQRKPDDYSSKNVTWLMKSFLRKYTGLGVSTGDEENKRIKCALHGCRCRIQKQNNQEFRLMLALVQQWLYAKGESSEQWVEEARRNAARVCEKLEIGTLPAMQREEGFLVEMDKEEFGKHTRLLTEKRRSATAQQMRSKRTKKRKNTDGIEVSPEDKFEERWQQHLDVLVGPNMYQQTDGKIYLGNLLSEGYKFRTKKFMMNCMANMLKKLENIGLGNQISGS